MGNASSVCCGACCFLDGVSAPDSFETVPPCGLKNLPVVSTASNSSELTCRSRFVSRPTKAYSASVSVSAGTKAPRVPMNSTKLTEPSESLSNARKALCGEVEPKRVWNSATVSALGLLGACLGMPDLPWAWMKCPRVRAVVNSLSSITPLWSASRPANAPRTSSSVSGGLNACLPSISSLKTSLPLASLSNEAKAKAGVVPGPMRSLNTLAVIEPITSRSCDKCPALKPAKNSDLQTFLS
mmetsp:Transcript_90394/g.251233  ORF Transcript_90394/g.251233 Transcript_90394/m.251233 type:complete len:241 (-) Transcript_90394:499-1221(-)